VAGPSAGPLCPILYSTRFTELRESRGVQTCAVCVAPALTIEGQKELLGPWVGDAEGAKFRCRS
jgi:transposase-like protein